ncbi:MAG: hypothetical protein NC548_50605 [Lachnospiraceae bacterium]|nr:hypothetical protein [Lachnospiraceae bacterium]
MASIQELIGEVSSIKQKSEELSAMVAAANQNLANQGTVIANLVRGSQTGQEAVMALSVANRALADAAASIRALGRTCDSCIQNLAK